jgi:hypothetical protein
VINTSWRTQTPGAGVDPNFSARYQARLDFGAGGAIRFDVVADDGVRVKIDGTAIIDQFLVIPGRIRSYDATVVLSPGTHDVEVEFVDFADWAVLRVGIRPEPASGAPSIAAPPSLGIIDAWAAKGDSSGSSRMNHQAQKLSALTVDTAGDAYVADSAGNRVFKVPEVGPVSVIAGTGASGFSGDGGLAVSARLNAPEGVAYSSLNNSIYIADTGNHRVRKVDLATGVITTVAGTGTSGFTGDGGPATSGQLDGPTAVVVDSEGDLVLIDHGNRRVREIRSADASIRTLVGGLDLLGPRCTSWLLADPVALAIDRSDGTVYVGDQGLNVVFAYLPGLERCEPTVGGGSVVLPGIFGEATEATDPSGLAVLANGDLLISDRNDHTVRRWSKATAQVWVVVGQAGLSGTGGMGGPAENALITHPRTLAAQGGNVWIVEYNDDRIRRIAP